MIKTESQYEQALFQLRGLVESGSDTEVSLLSSKVHEYEMVRYPLFKPTVEGMIGVFS